MNNFETQEGRISSEKIQRLITRLKNDEGKKFELTETDDEYRIVVDRGNGPETSIIVKSGDDHADEGAIFMEIMSPHSRDEYVGSERLGKEEEI